MIGSLFSIDSEFALLSNIQASLPPISTTPNDNSKALEDKDNELVEMKLQLRLLQQQVYT